MAQGIDRHRSLTVRRNQMKGATVAAISTGFALGLGITPPASADPCKSPDHLTEVTGDKECLVIQTYNAAPENQTLVVFIHGDGSRGDPSDYFKRIASEYTGNGATGVILIRPGYYDSEKRKSTGTSYRKKGDGYRKHIVNSVADAVQRLKTHHDVQRVILVGHSGGAAIPGVILGRHPGLAQAALLLSCPCDINRWRTMHQRRAWRNSLSPHRFIDEIPQETRVIALTGSKDNNTVPALARDYVATLTDRGITAEFVLVDGAGHGASKKFSSSLVDALAELITDS